VVAACVHGRGSLQLPVRPTPKQFHGFQPIGLFVNTAFSACGSAARDGARRDTIIACMQGSDISCGRLDSRSDGQSIVQRARCTEHRQ
jgi:hypothetical protein